MKRLRKLVVISLAVLGGLTLLFFGLVLAAAVIWPVQQPLQSPGVVSKQKTDKPLETSDIDINVLFNETNRARTEDDVARLSLNPELNDSAADKCLDMVKRNYWAHNTPDGTAPWVFIKGHVDDYAAAGENLAYGFTDAKSVVEGWIASSGHRRNLVDKRYTDVGFGVCKSDNFVDQGQQLVVVQYFISQ